MSPLPPGTIPISQLPIGSSNGGNFPEGTIPINQLPVDPVIQDLNGGSSQQSNNSLNFADHAKLSFLDQQGQMDYLKQKYK